MWGFLLFYDFFYFFFSYLFTCTASGEVVEYLSVELIATINLLYNHY